MKYKFEKINKWYREVKDDPVGYIVFTHLYVEYGLNYMVYRECENHEEILNNFWKYTFVVKLDLLYRMKIFDEKLYKNINVLNKIRNKMVHNLDINYEELELEITELDGTVVPNPAQYYNVRKNDIEQRGLLSMIKELGDATIAPLNALIFHKYTGKALDESNKL